VADFESRSVEGHFEVPDVRAMVKNASDEPVFEVKLEIVFGDGMVSSIFEQWDVLPPQQLWAQEEPGTLGWRHERPYVHVMFTDAAGRRWERSANGRLSKLPPSS
jgi:hypothetical protein